MCSSSGRQMFSFECLAELMVCRGCAVVMVFLHGGARPLLGEVLEQEPRLRVGTVLGKMNIDSSIQS